MFCLIQVIKNTPIDERMYCEKYSGRSYECSIFVVKGIGANYLNEVGC